jgi:predicted phosphodiesterase
MRWLPVCLFLSGCAIQNTKPIILYGDTGMGQFTHQQIVQSALQFDPIAVFHLGDRVFNKSEIPIFSKIISKFDKYYFIEGNHDLSVDKTYYSVNIGNIHFIIFDSNIESLEQREWLKQDLAIFSNKTKFIVVLLHYPPFNSYDMTAGYTSFLQSKLVPIFEQYNIDIVFSGHIHCYERLLHNGIYYIVSGGAGSLLMPCPIVMHSESQVCISNFHYCVIEEAEDKLVLKVFNKESELIDVALIYEKARPK